MTPVEVLKCVRIRIDALLYPRVVVWIEYHLVHIIAKYSSNRSGSRQ